MINYLVKIVLLMLFFILFNYNSLADSKSRILVYSWASEDYERPFSKNGRPIPEICAFLEGSYYPDESEDQNNSISFQDLIEILAREMNKENFVLNQPPEIVDYILLVNWGFTEEVNEETIDYFDEEIMFFESEDGSTEEITMYSTNQFTSIGKDNAKLIGAMKMSQLYPYSLKRKLLLEASEEKRLFVNISAFNKNYLINKSESEALKADWITFLSIPFYNISSTEALESLAEIGSRHMGYDSDSPSFMDYNKNFSTDPLELEYIGVEE